MLLVVSYPLWWLSSNCKTRGSKAVSALSRAGTPLLPPVSKLLLFSLQIGFVFAHLTCVSQETESLGEYCIGWLENVLFFLMDGCFVNNKICKNIANIKINTILLSCLFGKMIGFGHVH